MGASASRLLPACCSGKNPWGACALQVRASGRVSVDIGQSLAGMPPANARWPRRVRRPSQRWPLASHAGPRTPRLRVHPLTSPGLDAAAPGACSDVAVAEPAKRGPWDNACSKFFPPAGRRTHVLQTRKRWAPRCVGRRCMAVLVIMRTHVERAVGGWQWCVADLEPAVMATTLGLTAMAELGRGLSTCQRVGFSASVGSSA